MASTFTGVVSGRPMYSKIAASGLRNPAPQQPTSTGASAQMPNVISMPQDGTHSVSPSHNFTGQAFTPKPKKLVMQTTRESKDTEAPETHGPQVHIHDADPISPSRGPHVLEGMLMPSGVDEAGTQVSSSSGSAKPPSLDGKSITSGTTFALDEKESLRPDDSASVKATEDEDGYAFLGSGLPASRTGSDDGVRAFRDQLREISSIQPAVSTARPQDLAHGGHPLHGVLYIPPDGSGVGVVPGATGVAARSTDLAEHLPDAKLLEALESPKDRIMVLKLEQDIVDFVKDPKESSLTLPQTNAFYRMLAHKLADYYMLGHTSDESTSAVRIYKTPTCRIPPPLTGIATPSTAASTPPPAPPQMKILRRGLDGSGPLIANGSNTPFGSTSENGEVGGEEKRPSVPASREAREAKYEEARRRIMGSAKPSDSPPENVSQKEDSRSSSAAGKKNQKKKHRADSDDDFEARSAFSAYYPTPFTTADSIPTYSYASNVDPQSGQYASSAYGGQDVPQAYSSYGAQGGNSWASNAFSSQQPNHAWSQNQQTPYDLSRNFQQAMSFQPSQQPPQATNPPASFGSPYMQQYPAPQQQQQQQQWQQQSTYTPSFIPQQNYPQGFNPQQQPGAGQMGHAQGYAYGQLPSQAFPGRPASKLEHPLPGSYKSKHFNPQSQTFVPGHGPANFNNGVRGFPPQGVTNVPFVGDPSRHGYNLPYPPQRQVSGPQQQQRGPMGSPHANQLPTPPRVAPAPMVHPLPQPVFPRHPSPNVPLPPKPADQSAKTATSAADASSKSGQSTLAKWGANASLPAKPLGGIPSFGSMPPMASAYNASSGQGR